MARGFESKDVEFQQAEATREKAPRRALTADERARDHATMFAFGLGTLPAVMGVGIMTSWLTKLARVQRFKQAAGVLLIAFALLAAFPEINPMRVDHIMTF